MILNPEKYYIYIGNGNIPIFLYEDTLQKEAIDILNNKDIILIIGINNNNMPTTYKVLKDDTIGFIDLYEEVLYFSEINNL